MKSLFICLLLVVVSSASSIFSFTPYEFFQLNSFGKTVINQTLSKPFYTPEYVNNYNPTISEFDLFVSNDESYCFVKYNSETNTFYNNSESISLVNNFLSINQMFQVVQDKVFYKSVLAFRENILSILSLDFNSLKSEFIFIPIQENFVSSYPTSTYNKKMNIFYTLFSGSDSHPYIHALQLPFNNVSDSGVFYKFPTNSKTLLPQNNNGLLASVVGSSVLNYVNYNETNGTITICSIDFESLDCELQFTQPIIVGKQFFPFFFTNDNQFVVTVGIEIDSSDPTNKYKSTLLFTFINLSNYQIDNSKSFSSINFFIDIPTDSFFYYQSN